MLLRLTCPECEKDSYSISVENFKPCPYCGILFSGKYGTEKRDEGRINKEIPFILPYKGQNLEASTINFSKKGLSIKIFGKPSLPVGDVMEFSIGNSLVKAQILWFFNAPEVSMAVTGLKILEGSLNPQEFPGLNISDDKSTES